MLLMAMFAPLAMNAQSNYEWGSSSTNSGTNRNANPFGRYYGYEYRVYLYPPNTMPFSGNITQLEFLPSTDLSSNGGQIDVWMKTTTTITSLDETTSFATYKSGATQVYSSSSSPSYTHDEYVAIPLSTPIAYNYTNNEYLMILVRSEANSTSGDGGNSFYFYNPGGASNNTWWTKIDDSDPGESESPYYFDSYGTGAYLPVIRFTYAGSSVPIISLNPSSATMVTGSTQTLTATYSNVTNPTITYSSSNTSVATVSGSGTTATVTGVAPGTATITATMNGTYTATCVITVEDLSYCTPRPSSVDGNGITNVTFGTDMIVNDDFTMTSSPYYYDHSNMIGGAAPGSTVEMSINYATNYGYYTYVWIDWDKDYTFSNDEQVYAATSSISSGTLSLQFNVPSSVTPDDYRMRIQGRDRSGSDPCYTGTYSYLVDYTLRVSSDPSIGLTPATAKILTGSTETITATIINVSGTPTITYTSSNTSVATVSGSGTTATVTGVALGSATITASMTVSGTTYTATCAVTVVDLSTCEDFETGLGFWTVTADNASYTWARKAGTGGGSYSSAGQGSYNVGAYLDDNLNTYTYLTLNADLSSFTDKTISFMYINPAWDDDLDYIYLQYTTDGTNYTNLVSYTSGASSWTQVTDLAIPDEAKYIRFAAYSDYGYGAGLDEICFDYSIATCPKPTDLVVSDITATGAKLAWTPGDSETSWEYLCLTHGDTPDWASDRVITSTTHSNVPTNIYACTGQQPQPDTEYDFYVRAVCGGGDYSKPAMISFTTLESDCLKPTNVTASNLTVNSAHISWDGNADSYNVKYATATVTGTTLEPVFEDDFENGLDNWTTYANDFVSTITSPTYNITDWHQEDLSDDSESAHTGSCVAMSRSYDGNDRSVDNWLVSSQMTLGDVVKFWVMDDGAYHEYFEVYVSIGSGIVPSSGTGDFQLVEAPALATDSWSERTVDISAYSGQTGYVAIRHHDAEKDWLMVDDFGVYNTVNTYSYGTFTTLPPTSQNSSDITGLSPETLYVAQVQSDCGSTDGTSGWSSVYFTTPDACSAPTDLVSSNITANTATLGWSDNQDSYNVQYRKVYFYEDFEGENLPTGWTTIDANEDGLTWGIGHATTHSGHNGAYNVSYVYNTSGTTPDDYLVSPLLDLQGTLRVWLSGYARSSSNYSEHFEILLSTTGNSAADFTTTLVGETTTTDGYVEYTADLSSYTGQGYIAIHHFNCTDQYYLYVDDFGLYGTENWVSVSPNPTDATTTLTGLSTETTYEWQVQGLNCNSQGSTTDWSAVATFTTPDIPAVPVESITASDINVLVGATATITPTVLPADATNPAVTYTSANTSIATVENGVVTGVAPGNTTITIAATDGSGVTATINVTVTGVDVTGITASDVTVVNGQTATISYTVAPNNATDQTVTFTSANTAIATVDASGVVTAVAIGATTITIASVSNPEVTATINVTVTPDPNAVQFTLVAPATAQPGDVITVEAYMAAPTSGNYDGFTGLVLGIQFDTDAFEVYGDPTAGPVATASMVSMPSLPNTAHPDLVQYSLVMTPGNPNTTTGLVFSAQFTVLADAQPGSYTFTPGVTNGAANFIINMSNNPVHIAYEVIPSTVSTLQTFTKHIEPYTADRDRYYLIASPIGQVSPENVTNMTSNNYDLYYFDQTGDSEGNEWINYEGSDGNFDLVPGKGYLYANSGNNGNGIDLVFTGIAYTGSGAVTLALDNNAAFAGMNLVGNPFATAATSNMAYYRLNTAGDALNAETETSSVAPMEGIFVMATATQQSVTFMPTTGGGAKSSQLNLNLSQGNNPVDNAIIRFDGGSTLEKFSFHQGSTKIFITEEGKDYAVVNAGHVGEIPVSFKAEKNGSFSLSFTNQEVSFSYLHLIDNLTGDDVNLLANPSYTFNAQTTDYESRFRLVFATGNSADSETGTFGFINANGKFCIFGIEGEATVQVFDVLGHMLSSETFNGSYERKINGAPGVYMVRLINGNDVKTQKIVVE